MIRAVYHIEEEGAIKKKTLKVPERRCLLCHIPELKVELEDLKERLEAQLPPSEKM